MTDTNQTKSCPILFFFLTSMACLIALTVGLTTLFMAVLDFNSQQDEQRCIKALRSQDCHQRGMELGTQFQLRRVRNTPYICIPPGGGAFLATQVDPDAFALCVPKENPTR
jgi:hypothetical protein